MKITAEHAYLTKALGLVSKAVSSRNTLPILSNILIETEGERDRIKLTATDLDTVIHCTIPANVAQEGSVAIPAGVLNDVVSKLKEAPVTIDMDGGTAKVRSGKSDYSILSLSADDYPVTPVIEADAKSISIPKATWKRLLQQTTFCASKEETRSILMGALVEIRGGTLTVVTTDTHRLSWAQATFDASQLPDNTVAETIIPAKVLTEVERILSGDGEVRVSLGKNQVQFEMNDVVVLSRILDGQFPNYQKVIPKEFERTVTLNRMALLEATRRVFVVAKQNSEKAIFTFKDDLLELTSESPEVGKAYEEVPATLVGEPFNIAFNARYIMEFLNSMDSEQVELSFKGALNPALMTKPGDASWKSVVMPMQV